MIDRHQLLSDLQSLLRTLEADLLDRSTSDEVPEVGEWLQAEYEAAKQAGRTAHTWKQWLDDFITQVAAAWTLSCVFARFLEDNRLVEPPRISGPGERLQRARDEHTLFFQDPERAKLTDREYLLELFGELAELPAGRDVFGPHNPMNALPRWLGPDAAGELLRFFQKIDADSGRLIHDFTDPDWDTRFLGDLYQDLSEAARKKYALLQTPEFVEEFILDRTLEPALEEFGLTPDTNAEQRFKMIDPACGSGHFLLGTFPRLLSRWQQQEPHSNLLELTQRALDSIHGVDVNPYAIAIARFRLWLAALQACGITQLASAPAFEFHLACGDSLWHAPLRGSSKVARGQQEFSQLRPEAEPENDEQRHTYYAEEAARITALLREGQYHCVVANPPYIVPKDRALNQDYRNRYPSCHRQYSLAVPFMERIVRLALPADESGRPAGWTGQITANSFMKREFGKKLIESFFPRVDLTHVIDTSGAYIPGHGTPTVILFVRNQPLTEETIRTVMGIRGEPSTPDDPARGLVWSAIVDQIDQPGSQSEFVSVDDSSRELFHKHPWSIGGGGAAELKSLLEANAATTLVEIASEFGFAVITGEDNVLLLEDSVPQRSRHFRVREMVEGDVVRDWSIKASLQVLWPNHSDGTRLPDDELLQHKSYLWPYRTSLRDRKAFGIPVEEKGIPWWALREVYESKLQTPLTITYGEVATHNHFVLDRGGKVFKQTAPVIKLPAEVTTADGQTRPVTEDDHLALLGLLNSSTACFWMKQVCNCKGLGGQGGGIKPEDWHRAYAFNGTKLLSFPVPDNWESLSFLAKQCDSTASEIRDNGPSSVVRAGRYNLAARLESAEQMVGEYHRRLVALQEELDWQCYELFGLIEDARVSPESITSGLHPEDRPVEIRLRENIARGEKSIFYDVHAYRGATHSVTVSEDIEAVIEYRLGLIGENDSIRLIETPNYKRRWQVEPWDVQVKRALRSWLLDRLESYFDFDGRMNAAGEPTAKIEVGLISVSKLADVARQDDEFLEAGEVYRNDNAFDIDRLVEELVRGEHVPLLPQLRYKPSGLRNRREWEQTWELQRLEDKLRAGEPVQLEKYNLTSTQRDQLIRWQAEIPAEQKADERTLHQILSIPVPPKYKSSDFISTGKVRYWALRGKLDVPKERWVGFPHCEASDGSLMIAWAGYNHLQLTQAISGYYVEVQERLGGRDDPRLQPLLAGVMELLPWLEQWHHDVDPEFDQRMDEVYRAFVDEEARALGMTWDEIKAWQPPKKTAQKTTRKTKGASE